MAVPSCCLKGFEWGGSPCGHLTRLSGLDTYVTGDSENQQAAVLLIHDLLGWAFPNVRLLADHYAREAGVTVYVPDFFAGDALSPDLVLSGQWDKLDVPGFLSRHSRDAIEPNIVACAHDIRRTHGRVGVVGFCWGGWAAMRLGAVPESPVRDQGEERPLVDFVAIGHPSLLTGADIDTLAAPLLVLAPQHDPAYTPELKAATFAKATTAALAFEYIHFHGQEHGCLVRGSADVAGEREAMARAKDAVVRWIKRFLCEA